MWAGPTHTTGTPRSFSPAMTAAPTYKGGFGFHPLVGFLATSGEAFAWPQAAGRPGALTGSSGSSRMEWPDRQDSSGLRRLRSPARPATPLERSLKPTGFRARPRGEGPAL